MLDFHHWPASTGLLSYLKMKSLEFSDVGSTPFEVLEEAGSLQLRKYKNPVLNHMSNKARKSPVVLIPSFINRSFILDLLPEKSFVCHFLNEGHDVYLIDWGVPEDHEKHTTFETLMTVYLDFLVRKIHADCKGEKVHLVGHCIGGTLSLVLANLMSDYFLSLTLLTAPVKFEDQDKLSLWASEPQFDASAFIEAYGNIPWAIMQGTFLSLKPTQLWTRAQQFLEKSKDKKFLRNTLAMEAWINDNVNLRAYLFKFIIDDLYKKNSIASGTFTIGEHPLNLKEFNLPIFLLVSQEDHIVPASSHLRAEMVPNVTDFEIKISEGGHIGALVGSRAQKTVWPALTQWMAKCEKRNNE